MSSKNEDLSSFITISPAPIIVLTFLIIGALVFMRISHNNRVQEDVQKADFMLRCTIEYGIDTSDCVRMLQGYYPKDLSSRDGC